MAKKCRVISFYLPQYYPIPENDEWWGKGFTEWTNVAKAKPLMKNHIQPKIPGELGFYDLRVPETRLAQAELAEEHGIEGFCYWHYWFGINKTLLDMPFKKLLESKSPDFPFCLAWANITWGGLPYGDKYKRILIEQTYGGINDYKEHFNYILPAFKDHRYLKINERPIFVIYNPKGLPDTKEFINCWNSLAEKENIKKIYFIAYQHFDYDYKVNGFDALIPPSPSHLFERVQRGRSKNFFNKAIKIPVKEWYRKKLEKPNYYYHSEISSASNYNDISKAIKFFPNVIPNWDHTPRSGRSGALIIDPNPDSFLENLQNGFERISDYNESEKIIFIKAWNEWAEGNYLEPDIYYGRAFLQKLKDFIYD